MSEKVDVEEEAQEDNEEFDPELHPELVEDTEVSKEDEKALDDEEVEEAIKPVGLRDPGQPTKREREEHELTHQPPRPWCDECNMGRGQHDHHQTIRRADPFEESAIPTISLDYCFLGDGDVRAARNPILVVFDNKSTMIGAWQTYEKGQADWVVREVAAFIRMIGYGQVRVTLRSDGEASIVALKRAIAAKRDGPTTLIETPARESKCNATMEVRVKSWQAQFRTMMFDLRKCIGRKVPLLSKTTSWLTQWLLQCSTNTSLTNPGEHRINGSQMSTKDGP